jgi:hypothetical protein
VAGQQKDMAQMKTKKTKTIVLSSSDEKNTEQDLVALFRQFQASDSEVLAHLGLFLTSKNLSRLLFFYEMYKKIVNTHGVIIEFGVRWGQTLSLLTSLRSIFEPFNRHRKIIGFDTFEGFKGVASKDGSRHRCSDGDYSVAGGHEVCLDKILGIQEKLNPMGHLKRYELVKGDATKTVPAYFRKHPETMVSLAMFDFDIYAPTKAALMAIKPHLMKGSILVFDELCDDIFPGETIALQEVFGLKNVRVGRLPMTSRISYIEVK